MRFHPFFIVLKSIFIVFPCVPLMRFRKAEVAEALTQLEKPLAEYKEGQELTGLRVTEASFECSKGDSW